MGPLPEPVRERRWKHRGGGGLRPDVVVMDRCGQVVDRRRAHQTGWGDGGEAHVLLGGSGRRRGDFGVADGFRASEPRLSPVPASPSFLFLATANAIID